MSYCGSIAADILAADCNDLPISGVETTAWIMNLADIDKTTSTVDSDGMVTNIAITTVGKAAYTISALEKAIRGETALTQGTYKPTWDHIVGVKIFDNCPLIKKSINDLTLGRYVIVIANKWRKTTVTGPEVIGQTVYEVYGWGQGLVAREATRATDDTELSSGWNVVLGCAEGEMENFPPRIVFKTSEALTLAMLVALETPVPGP